MSAVNPIMAELYRLRKEGHEVMGAARQYTGQPDKYRVLFRCADSPTITFEIEAPDQQFEEWFASVSQYFRAR